MILSHRYKFIFIHIGKTGGTSIAKTLCQLIDSDLEETKYNKEIINSIGNNDNHGLHIDHTGNLNCKHVAANDLKKIIGDEIWQEYFIFSFVRNPYDRLLSMYSMFTQYKEFKNHPWNNYPSFQSFLNSIVSGETIIGDNPYHRCLTGDNDKLLVDFIGKFESLQESFNEVCSTIGLPQTELPHETSSTHKPYRNYYTPQAMEMVYKINKKDFTLFDFQKGIPGVKPATFFQKIRIHLQHKQSYPSPVN
ncbi:MAG: sulfotransferase family protein [Desulfocapsa sp.]|nr:sulfotransferase family protein [Desulfocapsa sp.]